MMCRKSIDKTISAIPPGYSEVMYCGKKYGITRTDFNDNKSTKIYAEELGGSDYISFNYYRLTEGNKIKACEMPKDKVLNFLSML